MRVYAELGRFFIAGSIDRAAQVRQWERQLRKHQARDLARRILADRFGIDAVE